MFGVRHSLTRARVEEADQQRGGPPSARRASRGGERGRRASRPGSSWRSRPARPPALMKPADLAGLAAGVGGAAVAEVLADRTGSSRSAGRLLAWSQPGSRSKVSVLSSGLASRASAAAKRRAIATKRNRRRTSEPRVGWGGPGSDAVRTWTAVYRRRRNERHFLWLLMRLRRCLALRDYRIGALTVFLAATRRLGNLGQRGPYAAKSQGRGRLVESAPLGNPPITGSRTFELHP